MTQYGPGARGAGRGGPVSFAAVKAATDLYDLVRESGVEINRSRMACCPFHDDRHPSLSIKGERWRCFGCGAHGDAIDWCERFFRMDTGAALMFLAARAGIGPVRGGGKGPPGPGPDVSAAIRKRELAEDFRAWVSDQRWKNADLIRKVAHTIDLVVKTPADLGTERAAFLYDTRAKLEGIDELLWGRDIDALADYYREKMTHGF